MNQRLIINADDFGLTRGVNRAIADLFRAGALSSATLMANGRAFGDAAALAAELPGLGVGCHVVLVDGDPVCAPETVSSLLGSDRKRLRPSLSAFARAALLGGLDEAEIEHEASAQVTRLRDRGIAPTHLDSHKHTHMFPAVLRPLLRVAERFGIPAIRNPFEQAWSLSLSHPRPLRKVQVQLLGMLERSFHQQVDAYNGRIQTTAGAIGVAATGDLDAATLTSVMAALPSGTWEFVCHPGFCDDELRTVSTRLQEQREVERLALMAVVQNAARDRGIELVSFAALQATQFHGQRVVTGAPEQKAELS